MNKYLVEYAVFFFPEKKTIEVFSEDKRSAEKLAFMVVMNDREASREVNPFIPFKTVKKLRVKKDEIVTTIHNA